ncbi:hypothetical protein FOF71_01915 [Lactobacillus paragasseri]|uniref:Secreted protein n=1 Tax=Lactobacillus gasseri TaxID=1596 RepID=A0AB33ZWE9_LACGS|nr:hypothetical protein FOF76_02090 [Lactobacillus gasseri]TVV00902.1 hypothetical protein FOF71_01915 [Lactobacillus paragasseri]GBA97203.1 hypothetical protein LJCM1025_14390 [Lactobacillus gasseri]
MLDGCLTWRCLCLYWALGLYCLVIGKAGARYDQVGKSRKKAHKGYPRFVEEKISKQKKPLHNFWPSLIATF